MFAGARCEYHEADYVIIGVPFDLTSTFRAGSAMAPDEIRQMSYCFEPYMMEYGVSISDMKIHDLGDVTSSDTVKSMGEELYQIVNKVVNDDKFPIVIGGDHSISPYIVSAFEDVSVLILDAHLDFRDSYEEMKNSHATVSKRISELNNKGVKVCGVRSMSQDESNFAKKPLFLTSHEMLETDDFLDELMENIEGDVYLSIDMDVFDPCYAPGVGNPEPYGLTPVHYKKLISMLSPRLVGMDIVELCPRYDNGGITTNLATKMIYDLLGSREGRFKE